MHIELTRRAFRETDRPAAIRTMLKGIASKPDCLCVTPRSDKPEEVVLSVSDTRQGMAPGFCDTRFALVGGEYWGIYYERWRREGRKDGEYLCLYQLCFNVVRVDAFEASVSEVVMLHADPDTADSAPHSKYKRSPHLHVCEAKQPWPHVHLALALGEIGSVSGSIDALTSCLARSVDLLRDQFLLHT